MNTFRGNGAAHWHTDMSFDRDPGSNTMLYCKRPGNAQHLGGPTSFIDMMRAYQELGGPGDTF